MSHIADSIRPFWLQGIKDISGRTVKDIGGWICDENYQVYSAVSSSKFSLYVYDAEPLLSAFATEITRIAIAAFQTLNEKILQKDTKPIAWFLIQRYYAAFFAAHALMRMMGSGCGPLGKFEVNSILKVANLWGAPAPSSYSGGLHRFEYDETSSTFLGHSLSGSPHEGFWTLFDNKIREIAIAVLDPQLSLSLDTIARQAVSTKLDQLRENFSFLTKGKPSWLTQIRNSINYDQKFGSWYPYDGRQKYYKHLHVSSDLWENDAMDIELVSYGGEDLIRFQATCNFILSMCRETIEDMSNRCSGGVSFHKTGVLGYINLSRT